MCWPGNRIGRPEISSWSFAEGDVRAPERDRADHHREQDRDEDVERDVPAERRGCGGTPTTRSAPRRRRRRRCRARPSAASGSSGRGSRRPRRPAVPIADPDHDQAPVADHVERAAWSTTAIAIPTAAIRLPRLRGRRVGALPDAEDEQREGDDVTDLDEVRARREGSEGDESSAVPSSLIGRRPLGAWSAGFGLRLNMPSIRSVTMKPPTMLIVPKAIAIVPIDLLERVVGDADHDQAAEHDDAVDRVGLRHQRRVQRRRHLRDHLEADEGGQHEDRDLGDQVHQLRTPAASRARSFRISPSWVMQAPATISSSKSRLQLALVGDQQLEQVLDVLGVELRGVGRHLARQVRAARSP